MGTDETSQEIRVIRVIRGLILLLDVLAETAFRGAARGVTSV
jgi:hypothetical protein